MSSQARVMVYGAGLGGLATTYLLRARHGARSVRLIDPLPPLELAGPGRLTYRNWWHGADEPLVRLANRSIDLLEDLDRASGGRFRVDRRGDLLVTTRREQLDAARTAVARLGPAGLGPLREHQGAEWYLPSPETGIRGVPDGVDLLEGSKALAALFPFLSPLAAGGIHLRRAGSLDGGRLGQWLLDQVRALGVEPERDELAGLEPCPSPGRRVRLASGEVAGADVVVLAPGPRSGGLAARLGLDLAARLEVVPRLELPARVVPNDSPNLVSIDPVRLEWGRTEVTRWKQDPTTSWVLGQLPAGLSLELGAGAAPTAAWPLGIEARRFEWPASATDEAAEVLARGLAALVPGLARCRSGGRDGQPMAGYLVRTAERHAETDPIGPGIFWVGGFGAQRVSLLLGAADSIVRRIVDEG